MELSGLHKTLLFKESAITSEVVEIRGYRTMTNPEELLGLGFESYQALTPGLLIPLHDMFGNVTSYQYRPDNPRKNAEGKLVKYETRAGHRQVLDANPILGERLRDPKEPLIVTGVWCWRKDGVPLPEWEDIKLYGREVYVAFDSDAQTNPHVLKALIGLCEFLRSRGANA
jgi:hypothetical protein